MVVCNRTASDKLEVPIGNGGLIVVIRVFVKPRCDTEDSVMGNSSNATVIILAKLF